VVDDAAALFSRRRRGLAPAAAVKRVADVGVQPTAEESEERPLFRTAADVEEAVAFPAVASSTRIPGGTGRRKVSSVSRPAPLAQLGRGTAAAAANVSNSSIDGVKKVPTQSPEAGVSETSSSGGTCCTTRSRDPELDDAEASLIVLLPTLVASSESRHSATARPIDGLVASDVWPQLPFRSP